MLQGDIKMRMRDLRFLFACVLAGLCLNGCFLTLEGDGKPLPRLTFEHLALWPLDVAQVEIYGPSGGTAAPESFKFDLAALTESYLHRRLGSAGAQGTLQVFVREASVHHTYEPSAQKAARVLDVGGTDKYTARVEITLEHRDARGALIYGRSFFVVRTINIPEYVSLVQRERRQMEGIEALFAAVDAQIQDILARGMGLMKKQ